MTTPVTPSPPGRGRPFAGPADLRAMEACLARSWNLAGPLVNTTPGDLEWWVSSASPGEDWSRRIRLWSDDDGVAAFGFFNPPGDLDWHQRAGLAPGVRAGLVDETLAWLASAARTEAAAGSVAAPPALETWAMDADAELGDLLSARGWTPAPEPAYTHFHRRLDGPTRDGGPLDGPGRRGDPRGAPPPTLPPGYRLRHVRLPDDLEARVEVHRSAFAPSRLTVEKYRAVATMPLYAPEHDLVVEAPDGSLAAFTMVWWIPEARLGEFEPVGTHASHRRLGLARALSLAGLRLLRDLGAVDALVFSRRTNEASEALYASVGFEALTGHRSWTHPLG